ncbi:MAG TPA: hypothetical protein EYQ00_12940 [Dehalococcoidia bacterium]|nr:hypothetical protein [Dehalococcoidia bacterium]
MERINLLLLLSLSSVAFAQDEWLIEEFTLHEGWVRNMRRFSCSWFFQEFGAWPYRIPRGDVRKL